jgi:hypothetical protein
VEEVDLQPSDEVDSVENYNEFTEEVDQFSIKDEHFDLNKEINIENNSNSTDVVLEGEALVEISNEESEEENLPDLENEISEETNAEDEFYLLSKDEIERFNNDMKTQTIHPVSEEILEQKEKEKDIPHYQVRKNPTTKKVEIVSSQIKEVKKMETSKKSVIQDMIKSNEEEILKHDIEIDVHRQLIKSETSPINVPELQRRLDNHSKNLEYLIKKQKALNEIFKNL